MRDCGRWVLEGLNDCDLCKWNQQALGLGHGAVRLGFMESFEHGELRGTHSSQTLYTQATNNSKTRQRMCPPAPSERTIENILTHPKLILNSITSSHLPLATTTPSY